jgi:hypothetical protein
MTRLKPFANESDALTIGELTIENRLDRLELYGSVAITRDQAGLKLALALKELLDATVTTLKSGPLPNHIVIVPPDVTDNPFK